MNKSYPLSGWGLLRSVHLPAPSTLSHTHAPATVYSRFQGLKYLAPLRPKAADLFLLPPHPLNPQSQVPSIFLAPQGPIKLCCSPPSVSAEPLTVGSRRERRSGRARHPTCQAW